MFSNKKCTVAAVGTPGLRKIYGFLLQLVRLLSKKVAISSYTLFPFCCSNGNALSNSKGKYSCPVITPSD
jgi:hypothetical protein